MTIRNREAYEATQPARSKGENPVFWEYLVGEKNPGLWPRDDIGPADIDGIVDINEAPLTFDWKDEGVPTPRGQGITRAALEFFGFDKVCIRGRDMPTYWEAVEVRSVENARQGIKRHTKLIKPKRDPANSSECIKQIQDYCHNWAKIRDSWTEAEREAYFMKTMYTNSSLEARQIFDSWRRKEIK